MDPERWRRVEDLFHRALERDESDRARFIDDECGGDLALREELCRWLAADADAPSHLARAVGDAIRALHERQRPLDAAAPAFDSRFLSSPPERIGAYRIISEIGHGGMGAVYLAERADDQFRQQVAIKVIRHSIDSPLVRARFLHERQLLAQLNHPGIARLLDGGTTQLGQPYFAMEYVAGRPLLEFCEVERLPPRERVRLFRLVCAAVQYAHRNLVVHRDIKPANILVTADGQPKLLDFGIAKLIEDHEQAAAHRTVTLMLTPDYASPEQVRGEAVTTGTDIYSLGCVLYELLCGRRPHLFENRTPGELERVICSVEPAPPGRFAALDEDLDNIVLKALRKDPAARYASAEQLSADIGNYLDGRPVSARPPTLGYRAKKFVRRNQRAVAASTLALLAVLFGAGAALWQARQASIQRDLAERRAREGRRLANTVLFSVEEKIRNLSGTTDARQLIMQSGVEYLDNLSRQASGDPSLQLELARAYERIGEVQGTATANLGQTDAARASFERAIGLLQTIGGSLDVRQALASVYLKHHMVLQRKAEPDRARESLRKSIEIAERLFAENPHDAAIYAILSAAYTSHATVEGRTGNAPAALDATRRALALTQDWAAAHGGEITEASLAAVKERLAIAQAVAGDLQGARTSWQEIIQVRERLTASQPTIGNRLALARAYNIYGDLLGSPLEPNWGETADALRYYQRSVAIRQELLKQDPANASTAIELAFTLFNIAVLQKDSAPADAVKTMRRAAATATHTLGAVPKNVEARRTVALMNMMCAAALSRAGQLQAALTLYPAVVDVLESMRAQEPERATLTQELMYAYCERGDTLIALNRGAEALSSYRRALAVSQDLQRPGNLRIGLMIAAVHERLEKYYRWAGNPSAACEWSQRRAALWATWIDVAPSPFTKRESERASAALRACH